MLNDAELLAHWPLRGDLADHSGHRRHLTGEVTFGEPEEDGPVAAWFDGRGDGLQCQGIPLGDGDFTLSARVWTSPHLDSVVGDVASMYDRDSRTGLNLSVLNLSGVTSSHPNHRTVLFGTDAGTTPRFTRHGRLGESYFVTALAVLDGTLYAGTAEGGDGATGRVFSYDRQAGWQDCGSPDGSNAVTAMAVLDGSLYVGTSFYRKSGSLLPDSVNTTAGGVVHRYSPSDRTWTSCGRIDPEHRFAVNLEKSGMRSAVCDSVGAMVVHRGQLYATPLYSEGLFRFDGGDTWTPCGSPGVRFFALASHEGDIWGATNERGGVVVTAGDGVWRTVSQAPDEVMQVYSFAVDENRLAAGIWPDGKVWWVSDDGWVDAGRLRDELEVMAMVPYNGQLYGGTLPAAGLFRRDADGWTSLGDLDQTADVTYRRLWSMAVYDGEIMCGLLPSGEVVSLEAGSTVSFDADLGSGWRQLRVVRAQRELRIYVDDTLVAAKEADHHDLTTDAMFRIGSGPHSTFHGAIADVRLYAGAVI